MEEDELNRHVFVFCTNQENCITIEQEEELRKAIKKIIPSARFLMFEEA